MADYTKNYNLKKPATTDSYDVNDFNENFDTIDEKIKEAYDNGGNIDSALSDTSENPVQNKVIKAALDDKVSKDGEKVLSTNDYTTEDKNKVANLPSNTNEELGKKVSSVKVNGVEQTITDGAVDIEVPDPDLSEYAKTEDVTTALAAKAPAYTYGTEDMTAGTWDSTAKTYSFESAYPSSQYDIWVQPNGDSITAEQLEAWGNAQIVGSSTSNALKAMGDVPTVDIPVIIRKAVK